MVFGNAAGQHPAVTCPVSRRHRMPEGSLVRVTIPLWPPVAIVTVVITWQRDQSALATHLFLHGKMARIGHTIIVSLRITRRVSFSFFLFVFYLKYLSLPCREDQSPPVRTGGCPHMQPLAHSVASGYEKDFTDFTCGSGEGPPTPCVPQARRAR